MEEKDYLKRWILSVNGIFKSDKDLKRYMGRPVGNSPEIMAWDCVLNQDLHLAVNWHVIYTFNLENDDKKFRIDTPSEESKSYKSF